MGHSRDFLQMPQWQIVTGLHIMTITLHQANSHQLPMEASSPDREWLVMSPVLTTLHA